MERIGGGNRNDKTEKSTTSRLLAMAIMVKSTVGLAQK